MTTQYDEKGKYFTDVISKVEVRATIQTRSHLLEGHIFISSNERAKDVLNIEERFLAVADAKVIGRDGEVLYTADFLVVNREHIVWVIPYDNDRAPENRIPDDAG